MANSLQDKALQRALGARIPKTLTPHEWEQWYEEHGVPEEHRSQPAQEKRRWWQVWR
jgi:hypothetical protein